jgi:hypothetical protein
LIELAPIESVLTAKQKENLELARGFGGFRSRTELILWFADNALDIVKEAVRQDKDPYKVRLHRLRELGLK